MDTQALLGKEEGRTKSSLWAEVGGLEALHLGSKSNSAMDEWSFHHAQPHVRTLGNQYLQTLQFLYSLGF